MHKSVQERARMQKDGGSVSSNGRLQGRLEVSRAFGDCQFKKLLMLKPKMYDIEHRENFTREGDEFIYHSKGQASIQGRETGPRTNLGN
ncbi:protein phosphatase 2C 8 [Pyrus ussuriensis x Pyrus communis]|uniref:Protein phosphatase 2C 8 n=1 Tax=Pyrus ussuriensis x Pyrus communis TaxID=2448454 RepID=A0A5N5GJG7_9ROSA|nr:protein phosphatase 2C 8 [Pyrus ussuriensis x Pyrus communis]